MAATVYDVLKKKIKQRVDDTTKATAHKAAKDYAEYTELCGKIAGLENAYQIIDDLQGEQIDDDD